MYAQAGNIIYVTTINWPVIHSKLSKWILMYSTILRYRWLICLYMRSLYLPARIQEKPMPSELTQPSNPVRTPVAKKRPVGLTLSDITKSSCPWSANFICAFRAFPSKTLRSINPLITDRLSWLTATLLLHMYVSRRSEYIKLSCLSPCWAGTTALGPGFVTESSQVESRKGLRTGISIKLRWWCKIPLIPEFFVRAPTDESVVTWHERDTAYGTPVPSPGLDEVPRLNIPNMSGK